MIVRSAQSLRRFACVAFETIPVLVPLMILWTEQLQHLEDDNDDEEEQEEEEEEEEED